METMFLVSKFLQLNGCLLFFWRWQWGFLQACMLQRTVATSAIIICSTTLSLSLHLTVSLSLSLARSGSGRGPGRVGELSLRTVYFNLRSCRGQRTVVSCMPWQLFLNSLLVWCHDRIRGKRASNALKTHS